MVVITTGRTSDIEYDVKALFSECPIHRFLYKVSSLKAMQVELLLDERCLNSCELLMIETKTNFASYCFKEIAYNLKATGWTNVNLLYLPDSIEITSLERLTLWCPEINQSKRPVAW